METDWLQARESSARALAHYRAECERMLVQSRSFEAARERLEIAEILESRSRARLEANIGLGSGTAVTA